VLLFTIYLQINLPKTLDFCAYVWYNIDTERETNLNTYLEDFIMKIYCLVCNEEFEADVATYCPCCGAVGDELMEAEEDEEA